MEYRVELSGRDFIQAVIDDSSSEIVSVKFFGCRHMVSMMRQYHTTQGRDPRKWTIPQGNSHEELLLRKFILTLKGEWILPINSEELCHCRLIPTATVEDAVISGAHSPDLVSRWTSASTACGTCRPQVEDLLKYLLPPKL